MQTLINSISNQAWQDNAPAQFRAMSDGVATVQQYLEQCPAYKTTPFHQHDSFAKSLGIERLFIKDESARMGLGSFKALGGAYAILQFLIEKHQLVSRTKLTTDAALMPQLQSAAKGITFCCASAGNHGLSVAAGAQLFGAKAVVYIAESVAENFEHKLRAKGAEVRREGVHYDDSMAAAREACDKNGWTLVSDSAWEGYEKTPLYVMQGYGVITQEIAAACAAQQSWPTHVFLQAGVGGLAGALANHIRLTWPEQPDIIVAEPETASCLMESVRAGRLTHVDAPGTNMGRLDCAAPSTLAFDILKQTANYFTSVSDQGAEAAAQLLADSGMATTPSGAAGLAALKQIVGDSQLRNTFQIDDNSRCLIIVTEGMP